MAPAGRSRQRTAAKPRHRRHFYWRPGDGGQEHGPLETLLQAEQEMLYAEDAMPDEPELDAIADVKAVLGVSDWIDPEIGEPAEEIWVRIEEH